MPPFRQLPVHADAFVHIAAICVFAGVFCCKCSHLFPHILRGNLHVVVCIFAFIRFKDQIDILILVRCGLWFHYKSDRDQIAAILSPEVIRTPVTHGSHLYPGKAPRFPSGL